MPTVALGLAVGAASASVSASERNDVEGTQAIARRGSSKRSSDGASTLEREASDARTERRRRLPHRGTILEASAGAVGCVGTLCGTDRLGTDPGVRVGGFFGGNIHGWVEMGVTGGWATMGSQVGQGSDVLSLYGLDTARLDARLAETGIPSGAVDVGGLEVRESRLRTAQLGPIARLHFNPRGRLMVWVGSGATYHLLRNDLATDRGRVRVDFHGLAIPLEGGVGVAVHRNFAVVAQFSYMWTRHFVTTFALPEDRLMIPTTMLEREAAKPGTDLSRELPTFWNVGLGVRTRF